MVQAGRIEAWGEWADGTDETLITMARRETLITITSVAAAPRSTNCPRSFSLLQTVVHEHAAVPAHSPHASMRPACTIDNAGPVRWMSEVSLPTSVAYNAGTLVQHRSVECQRYRCLRALPTSHCDGDESLVRAIDNAGTLVQHRSVSVECQRYRCLRALPTSHYDESLVRAIDNAGAGTLVQHRSVECQRYRCLRALPASHSHQHLRDAKTLVEPGLQRSNQRQSLPQKTGRLDKNAFLGRRPVLNRTHKSRQRLEDATEPLLASMRQA